MLPNNSITLDGSRSTDDQGVVSYLWIRDGQSPAAGVSTDREPPPSAFVHFYQAAWAASKTPGAGGFSHESVFSHSLGDQARRVRPRCWAASVSGAVSLP